MRIVKYYLRVPICTTACSKGFRHLGHAGDETAAPAASQPRLPRGTGHSQPSNPPCLSAFPVNGVTQLQIYRQTAELPNFSPKKNAQSIPSPEEWAFLRISPQGSASEGCITRTWARACARGITETGRRPPGAVAGDRQDATCHCHGLFSKRADKRPPIVAGMRRAIFRHACTTPRGTNPKCTCLAPENYGLKK